MDKKNQDEKETQSRNYDEHFKDDRPKSNYEIVRGSTLKTDKAFSRRPYMNGKKKIAIEYIEDKNKRGVTFSKRKRGIMKKAFELNKLTNSDILLVIANENSHVYTFATSKFKPIVARHGKLIEDCLKNPGPFEDGNEMTDYMSENKYYGVSGYYNYTGNNYRGDSSSYYSGTDSGYIDEKENIHNIGNNTSSYFSDDDDSCSIGHNTYDYQDDDEYNHEYTPHYQYYKK
ncbi:Serum response factor like protein A [Dictyocoela muelleri]|nr:Serum response factor like protein A [Dictyocoela muelleri]